MSFSFHCLLSEASSKFEFKSRIKKQYMVYDENYLKP